MNDMWQDWSSGSDNWSNDNDNNQNNWGGAGMSWGLDSLGAGLGGLPQGPGGRQDKRDKHHDQDMALQNYIWNKEFAQNSLKWKANQLKDLGINPVAMAGMQGSSYSSAVAGLSKGRNAYADIGRGMGQIGNKLLSMLFRKIDEASEGWKKNSRVTNKVVVQPSKTTHSVQSSPGIEAGAKTGEAVSVMKDNTCKIHVNEELSEALENQGWVDKGLDALNDTITQGELNKNPVFREKMRKAVLQSVRNSGKLKPGNTIYWKPWRQRFQIQKIKPMKNKKPMWKRLDRKALMHRARNPEYDIMK